MLYTKSMLCDHNETADFDSLNKFFYFLNKQNTFIMNDINNLYSTIRNSNIKVIFQELCFLSSFFLVLAWGGLEV